MTVSPRQKPSLVIIAGPNGSGKTTLTEEGDLKTLGIRLPEHYINPDVIAKGLRVAQPDADQKELEKEAFREARSFREKYRGEGLSFALETVFSHPSTFLDMKKCRAAGYRIILVYVTTGDADINVARVAGRIRLGGHAVEEQKIRDRYERSLLYLPRMVEEADQAIVFDSTEEGPMRRCFTKRRFTTQINPPEYLVQRLISVLEQRRVARAELLAFYSLVTRPNEEAGEYVGPIVATRASFAVQMTAENTFLLHDTIICQKADSFAEAAKSGSLMRITYVQGEGRLIIIK